MIEKKEKESERGCVYIRIGKDGKTNANSSLVDYLGMRCDETTTMVMGAKERACIHALDESYVDLASNHLAPRSGRPDGLKVRVILRLLGRQSLLVVVP